MFLTNTLQFFNPLTAMLAISSQWFKCEIRIMRGGVQTVSTRHVGHFWPIVPAPGECEDGEFCGIKIGRGNRSTRRKPVPAQLRLPEISLDQTRARTRAAAVRSQRLTT
jgi:hypothetical protein